MARPRKASVKLPPHVHAVKARGKPYYYFQRYRGTEREEPRIKLLGEPIDGDGTPNPEWWRAYRELSGEVQQGPKRGIFSALIASYKASPEWTECRAARDRSVSGIWRKSKRLGVIFL